MPEKLHIPDSINYECTGCGKCCSGWSVPLTPADYERISAIDWASLLPKFEGKTLFRELKDYEKQGTPHTHAIKEGDDGNCPFLVDNLCFIHSKFGATTKPAICQLFPYCFNETPSGTYASVSFVSMGVVNNSGKPLAAQRDYLEGKLNEFRALYPDHHPNWSKCELTLGRPVTWDEYLNLEESILKNLADKNLSLNQRFLKASAFLISKYKESSIDLEVQSQVPVNKMKLLDRHLLITLHKLYFPKGSVSRGASNFSAFNFFFQLLFEGVLLSPILRSGVSLPGRSFSLEDLKKMPWPDSDHDIDDLLYRYFYSRVYAKLYFGAGFGQLSVIAGFHHLIFLYVLIKLQSRAIAISREAQQVSYLDVVASVRQLEKRLGETALDGYAAAIFESLMFSSQRVKRVMAACH